MISETGVATIVTSIVSILAFAGFLVGASSLSLGWYLGLMLIFGSVAIGVARASGIRDNGRGNVFWTAFICWTSVAGMTVVGEIVQMLSMGDGSPVMNALFVLGLCSSILSVGFSSYLISGLISDHTAKA